MVAYDVVSTTVYMTDFSKPSMVIRKEISATICSPYKQLKLNNTRSVLPHLHVQKYQAFISSNSISVGWVIILGNCYENSDNSLKECQKSQCRKNNRPRWK